MEERHQNMMREESPKLFLDQCPSNIENTLRKILKWVKKRRNIPENREMYFAAMRTPPGAEEQRLHLDSLTRRNGWLLPLAKPPVILTTFKDYDAPKRPGAKATLDEILTWMKATQEGKWARDKTQATKKRGECQLFNPLVWHKGPAWPSNKKKGRVVLFAEWEVSDDPEILNRPAGLEGMEEHHDTNVATQVFDLQAYIEETEEAVSEEKKKRKQRARIPKKAQYARRDNALAGAP